MAHADVQPTFGAAEPSARQTAELRRFRSAMDSRLAPFMPSAEARRHLLERVYREARLARLPPSLVLALIEVESAFRPTAVSSAGAVGLMQIMPFWIDELGLATDDLQTPTRNLRYGCTILGHYLAVEGGDFTRALARYNGSLGKTRYPERVLSAWQERWRIARSGTKKAGSEEPATGGVGLLP
ncbi:MAG: transglycosylase SLT domain-containing protein [Halomonas sp.]|nr:transglycosylase SLT domain-containing protein [Halomonas sp.]MDN6296791.1 transglycosylase SLT domain-containing protein [Halomonas sp.]MDN6314065.1 transglycosylase SLT domain-containing protein [Halomonas sp.]MDN6335391.1 transglycosylase SLT domain-containing protein [Halomonas sp.]